MHQIGIPEATLELSDETERGLNPEFPSYEWALKVKKQLKGRGVEFPPPSPKEVREQRK